MDLLWITFLLQVYFASAVIRSGLVNKLAKVRIQPVGANVATFVALTEFPPPAMPHEHPHAHPHARRMHDHGGRRHLPEECTPKVGGREYKEGGKVVIMPDYYDERVAKTVATIIIPDHIDRKHFEVTTQVPYLTLGPIEAIGYHPSTVKSDHPSECEKIYQDHIDDQYTEESKDYSEESLEMARMPVFEDDSDKRHAERKLDTAYIDFK